MSSIIKIKCIKGNFVLKDCLKDVLREMNYSKTIKIVQNNDQTYSLEIFMEGDSINRSQIYAQLEKRLDEILPRIHQNYAIKVAIKELTTKGFELTNRKIINDILEIILEKIENNELKRMIISAYPDLRVTIDSVGFLHRNCDKYTKDLEIGMGGTIIKQYKSENISSQVRSSQKTAQRNQLKIGFGGRERRW